MNWTQVKVTCPCEKLETVCAVVSMLDSSILVEDYSDIETGLKTVYGDLIDESILNSDKTIASCSIFVSEDKNLGEYTSYIETRLAELGIKVKIELLGTAEEEWATAWKKYYKPTHIGNRMVVVPSWESYKPAPQEIVIEMDPGMAFGTGTHETTRLCAEFLEENVKSGDYVLDVGSGSGILAIFASKLGAAHCDACDIDPIAVRTEAENAARNGCDNIDCYVSDLLSDVKMPERRRFDIVSANIVADIIIRLSADVGAFLKEKGLFVASGIIVEREAEVDRAMEQAGFRKLSVRKQNGWCAELFQKG